MTAKPGATPRPWHYATRETFTLNEPGAIAIVPGAVVAIWTKNARGEPEEDVRLIVRAVNAHDALVAALRARRAHIDHCDSDCDECAPFRTGGCDVLLDLSAEADKLERAALALAAKEQP